VVVEARLMLRNDSIPRLKKVFKRSMQIYVLENLDYLSIFFQRQILKKLNCSCHQANGIVSHTPSKSSYYWSTNAIFNYASRGEGLLQCV